MLIIFSGSIAYMADGKIIVNGHAPASGTISIGPSAGQTSQAGIAIAIGSSNATMFDTRPVTPGEVPSCSAPEVKDVALGSGYDYVAGQSPYRATTVMGKRVVVAGLDIRKLAEQVDALQNTHLRAIASTAELQQLSLRIEKVGKSLENLEKARIEQHAAINGRLNQIDLLLRNIGGGLT